MDETTLRRMRYQQATPFARAIGLELLEWGHGFANTRLAPSGPTRSAAGQDTLHPWALIGMADHAISYAFTAAIPANAGMSTLDLRLDFGPAPQGSVTAAAHMTHLSAHSGIARLVAQDEAGNVPVTASAVFNFRAYPGGSGEMKRLDLPRFANDHDGPFEDFLALEEEETGLALAGNTRRTVGFEGLPALHGGVVGALLAAAATQAVAKSGFTHRLASLNIRYLRPGGIERLHGTATILRAGRSVAFVDAVCFHHAARPVAQAQVTFVPRD